MMRVIGAFVLTYFFSRALRYFGLRPPSVVKLVAAHVLSFTILALLTVALRYSTATFYPDQLIVSAIAQTLWLLLDLYRAQVAFWKPPVAPTESSQTSRAGRSR